MIEHVESFFGKQRKTKAYSFTLLALCILGVFGIADGKITVDGIVWTFAAYMGGNGMEHFSGKAPAPEVQK